jgi:PAS domain S-box-containing protein/putative nucleotidyltransferase with HDIG domain
MTDEQALAAPPTVLAVDDDADVLRATERILREAGFEVLTGTSAAEALELTRRHRPALVLLDVMLPDGNGVDVARQLKGDPALADVFVILCSGMKTSPDDQARGLAEGLADGYLTRPFSKPELLARIDAFLRIRATQCALRESEQRYRLLAEHTTDVIWLSDMDMRITYQSPSSERLRGYTTQELHDLPLEKNLTPESLRTVLALIHAEMPRIAADPGYNPVITRELEYYRKDGTTVWSESTFSIIRDGNGRPVSILGEGRDISERRRAEEVLRDSEERYRTLFERTANPTVVIDTAGDYINGNDAALRFLECSHEELLTKNVRDFIPPSSERVFDEHTPLWKQGGTIETQYYVNHSIKTLELTITPGSWRGEQVVFGIGVDITERTRAEEALRQSEQRFRLITEAIDEAFWMADVEIGKIFYVSRSFERIWGLSRESLYEDPRSFLEAVHVEDRERVLAELEIEKTGQPFDHEYRIVQPDGTTRHIWDRGFPIRDERGLVSSYAGIAMDITERKRAEEALRESEQNFRAFFDAVDDIIVVATPEGRLIYANLAVSAKLGYGAAELSGMQVLDLYPAEKRAAATAIYAAMLKGERESNPPPLLAKSGALIPVETRMWRGRWNGAACLFGISKDLSSEQEALQKFERLFRGNPALISVNSLPDGRFTDVNEAFVEGLGYSREEILGRTGQELGLFAQPGGQRELAEQRQARGSISARELKVRRKDGTVLEGLFSGEIIESHGQEVSLTVMIDQTERKQAEDALRQSEERYRSLFETMAEGVVLIAVDGRLISANPAAESILGLSRSQIADLIHDSSRWELLRPDGTPLPAKAIAAPLGLAAKDVVVGFARPDGTVSWISVNATPFLDPTGAPEGVVVSFADVTELKHAEQEIRESLATQQAITDGVITALSRSIEARDPYTAGHQRRVGELAAAMAPHMGLGEEAAEGLRVGGLLHDVGKINIPAEILSKPGLLTMLELELIKGHAEAGYEILAAIHFPWPVAAMAQQHHERLDGTGYPRGLKGEQILLEARLLAVADVVEAMASHRPYRPALGLEAAFAEVHAGAGTRFEAAVVAACERVFAEGFAFTEP